MKTFIISETSSDKLQEKISLILIDHGLYDIQISTCWSRHAESVIYTACIITK